MFLIFHIFHYFAQSWRLQTNSWLVAALYKVVDGPVLADKLACDEVCLVQHVLRNRRRNSRAKLSEVCVDRFAIPREYSDHPVLL